MSLLCQFEAIPAMYLPGVVPPVRDATRFPSQNATRDVVPTNPRYSHSPKRLVVKLSRIHCRRNHRWLPNCRNAPLIPRCKLPSKGRAREQYLGLPRRSKLTVGPRRLAFISISHLQPSSELFLNNCHGNSTALVGMPGKCFARRRSD